MSDEIQHDEPAATETAAEDEVSRRRAELLEQAREMTTDRPELTTLLDRVSALDDVDLEHHVSELDTVHRALRDALASAGRDEPADP